MSAAAIAWIVWAGSALAAEADAPSEPAWSGAVTGMYYAMRDQPDFGVGVGSLDRGPLHLEARYNYEARDAGSAFVGWKFSGGDTVTYEADADRRRSFRCGARRHTRARGERRVA